MISHGQVRQWVMGHERCNLSDKPGGPVSHPLTLEEKHAMAECVKEGIAAGAIGFSTNRFSLVDRGFVYAIAHIRGGTDKGYGWYLDGKLEKKTNTFRDFISAAEALIDLGFTRSGHDPPRWRGHLRHYRSHRQGVGHSISFSPSPRTGDYYGFC